MVVEPPKGEVVQSPLEEKLFIYPRKGQSEKQQSDDRYECHRWAVDQTHFDPTQPSGSVPATQQSQKYADYRRALKCMPLMTRYIPLNGRMITPITTFPLGKLSSTRKYLYS